MLLGHQNSQGFCGQAAAEDNLVQFCLTFPQASCACRQVLSRSILSTFFLGKLEAAVTLQIQAMQGDFEGGDCVVAAVEPLQSKEEHNTDVCEPAQGTAATLAGTEEVARRELETVEVSEASRLCQGNANEALEGKADWRDCETARHSLMPKDPLNKTRMPESLFLRQ